jgi:hypothetical protein
MTPFFLKNLLMSSIVILLCQPVNRAWAQQSDTIVIYDYVRVVDTMWVDRQNHDIKTLQAVDNEKIKCNSTPLGDTLQFHCPNSATYLKNPILSEENKEQAIMKKKGFIALLLLPFQMVSMGQVNYHIITGSSNMWLLHQTNTISNPVWSGVHFGAEVSFPFENSKIEVSTGVIAHFVFPPKSYKQIKTIDSSLPYLEYDYAQTYTNVIINELNTGVFASSYWQLAVPLKIGYQLSRRFAPFAGIAYRYTRFLYEVPENPSQWKIQSEQVNFFNDFEVLMGTRISMTQNLALQLNFSNGLTGKHNIFEEPFHPTLGIKEYYFKSLNFDISIGCKIPYKKL